LHAYKAHSCVYVYVAERNPCCFRLRHDQRSRFMDQLVQRGFRWGQDLVSCLGVDPEREHIRSDEFIFLRTFFHLPQRRGGGFVAVATSCLFPLTFFFCWRLRIIACYGLSSTTSPSPCVCMMGLLVVRTSVVSTTVKYIYCMYVVVLVRSTIICTRWFLYEVLRESRARILTKTYPYSKGDPSKLKKKSKSVERNSDDESVCDQTPMRNPWSLAAKTMDQMVQYSYIGGAGGNQIVRGSSKSDRSLLAFLIFLRKINHLAWEGRTTHPRRSAFAWQVTYPRLWSCLASRTIPEPGVNLKIKAETVGLHRTLDSLESRARVETEPPT
jgi:hypothetical protein